MDASSPDPLATTQLLNAWSHGDVEAGAQLVPIVYEELRRLASAQLGGRTEQHTLQPTALVHEAFIRLVGRPTDFRDRGHFFAVAATAMRQITVDAARRRNALKRGGAAGRVTISDVASDSEARLDVLSLEDGLTSLAAQHARPAKIAELRLFAGLTVAEVAQALDVSPRTVDHDWRFARSWLRKALGGSDST